MYNSYFEDKIRKRGFEYFKDGKVSNITEKDNKITATVSGQNTYHVEVLFNKDNDKIIDSAKCDCPYCTDKYHYCKHIYATILSVKYDEKLDREENLKEQKEKQKSIFDLKMKNEKELKECKKILRKIKNHLYFDRLYINKAIYKRFSDYSKTRQKSFNTILKLERKIGEDIFYYYERSKSIKQLHDSLIKNLNELEEIITEQKNDLNKTEIQNLKGESHSILKALFGLVGALMPEKEVNDLKVGDHVKVHGADGEIQDIYKDGDTYKYDVIYEADEPVDDDDEDEDVFFRDEIEKEDDE